ncbi:helix-turn-helix transcriptional regulator, partial [bacterium]|nr:helix-turn-helix transcriptional regulator [bacterium]
MTTGATIKLLRTAEGISQTHLAERLGISRSYL